MNRALEVLQERGFIKQCSNLEGLSRLMDEGPLTFYVGIDPTGPSLHIGHMLPVFALKHMCNAGHKGITLLGGGTARIGDPSGKTEMRKLISYEDIDRNTELFREQLDGFVQYDGKNRLAENNKNWLAELNYIEFLREIGKHFSVNRMLSFEAYKIRMESGLSFIEFNYQLLQSYDFLELYRRHGCRLQIGGDDQWGNIVAGIDLIRRVEGIEAFALTFPLITTSDNKKMGKTEKGALFLDPEMTPPYDFFQYWRNITDDDIERFLLIFTFLPTEECSELARGNPNHAKEKLAYEVTKLIHGQEAADRALEGARAAFSGDGDRSSMPTVELDGRRFGEGYPVLDLFVDAGLCTTKSEARRLVSQGGARVGEELWADEKKPVFADMFTDGELLLKAGKKRFIRVLRAEA